MFTKAALVDLGVCRTKRCFFSADYAFDFVLHIVTRAVLELATGFCSFDKMLSVLIF